MPIIKSAKKRLRQEKKKTVQNTTLEKAYKTALKQLASAKNKKEALAKAYKAIDKATKSGLLHKKRASRLKANASRVGHVKTSKVK
jgi:small subunit ribosomal protein S20